MRDAQTDRGTGLSDLRRYTWWAVPGTAALFLVFLIGAWVLDPDVPVWARGACAAALALTVVAIVALLNRRMGRPLVGTEPPDDGLGHAGQLPVAWLMAGGTGAVALGAVPLAFQNYGLWSIAPATMVVTAATFLPPGRRRVLMGAALAVAPVPGAIVSLIAGDDEVLFAAAFPPALLAMIAWVTLGPLWAWDIARRLDRARQLAAELAVKDERLRFAADLHDIQGHHLQVIALKSELAARLAGTDPARASGEMEEVQRLAAEALKDTRSVVHGYRRTTLNDEVANATKVLAAAGIDTRMGFDAGEVARTAARFSTRSRHLLGLVMREATTNVLRHSRARHADVDYRVDGSVAHLRMRNDGVIDPFTTSSTTGSTGTGLSALAERVQASGGKLTWERDGDRFVVEASLPVNAGQDGKTEGDPN